MPTRVRAGEGLATKPGPWGDLALTLPVFLAYQVGVVFLNVRNASDIVTSRLLRFAQGDPWIYFGLTGAIGVGMLAVFAIMGRGQILRVRKLVQIAIEGAAYAFAMGVVTSWVVGRIFARPSIPVTAGPLAGLVMSFGAGFYEELAFRVLLFGVGVRLLGWLLARPGLARILGVSLWAVACATIFSAMHYVGALGDVFEVRSFVARTLLGLALTLVYATRGFAAAVWTHALYDVWVVVL